MSAFSKEEMREQADAAFAVWREKNPQPHPDSRYLASGKQRGVPHHNGLRVQTDNDGMLARAYFRDPTRYLKSETHQIQVRAAGDLRFKKAMLAAIRGKWVTDDSGPRPERWRATERAPTGVFKKPCTKNPMFVERGTIDYGVGSPALSCFES